MRGIKSEGMVLSEKELGLSDEHEGIHILDANLPVGVALREVLGETVLALELQPNRPDCLGVVGIAREVAALLGTGLREPPVDRLAPGAPKGLDVRIEDDRACPRFAAALLSGIEIGPSPAWMQARLVAAGMRPIDNVVDITNYVMLEVGQPLHAYDHRQLRGGALVARQPAAPRACRSKDRRRRRSLPESAPKSERAHAFLRCSSGYGHRYRSGGNTRHPSATAVHGGRGWRHSHRHTAGGADRHRDRRRHRRRGWPHRGLRPAADANTRRPTPASGAASPRRVPRTGARRSGRIRASGDRLVLAHRSRVAEAAHRRRLMYRAGASARGEPDHGVAVRGSADPACEPARHGAKEPAAPIVRRDLRDRSYISAKTRRSP